MQRIYQKMEYATAVDCSAEMGLMLFGQGHYPTRPEISQTVIIFWILHLIYRIHGTSHCSQLYEIISLHLPFNQY
jgi:hypothetical protein